MGFSGLAGQLLGSYLAAVAGSRPGSFSVGFEINGKPLGAPQLAALVSPTDRSLRGVTVIFGGLEAPLNAAKVGQSLEAKLVGIDASGNYFLLTDYQVPLDPTIVNLTAKTLNLTRLATTFY